MYPFGAGLKSSSHILTSISTPIVDMTMAAFFGYTTESSIGSHLKHSSGHTVVFSERMSFVIAVFVVHNQRPFC